MSTHRSAPVASVAAVALLGFAGCYATFEPGAPAPSYGAEVRDASLDAPDATDGAPTDGDADAPNDASDGDADGDANGIADAR